MSGLYDRIQDAVKSIQAMTDLIPQVGMVLGSGLGAFANTLDDRISIPYGEIPHFPVVSVAGHAGNLVIGRSGGLTAAVLQGRVHAYEGHPMEMVTLPTRVLCALGAHTLVVTNAAGGVNSALRAGDLMLITDHLNLSGRNALIGDNDDRLGPRFPDMTYAYDPELRELANEAARSRGIDLRQGVYAALSGPSYETPAEIRMLAALGADAVGMSTVHEVITANHMGKKVLGISCISNLAAGISSQKLNHSEVEETGRNVEGKFKGLLAEILSRLAAA